ncbi:MAG: endonuclease/exonuclease/phosphatase family protein [Kiritimatiellae bacterium]|nr:endonuclease/exonuclease/phosphatase family protein [Kiritimatiellia bacterium]
MIPIFRAFRFSFVLSFGLLVLAGCGRAPDTSVPDYTPGADEFSVMSFNLHQYSLQDRDGDGQVNDPKPAEERRAVVEIIRSENPDILVVQEMGDPSVFQEFLFALKEAGLDYEHVEYLRRGKSSITMALLSRFPFASRESHLDDIYSIGEAKLPVARGFIDVVVQVNTSYTIRILGAHLKAKVFSPMGHTEMRRNEARLLNKNVRQAMKNNPAENILVLGDLNDSFQSAALREVMGKRRRILFDLRPLDEWGDAWTHFNREDDSYARIDYFLVNGELLSEINRKKTRTVRNPLTYEASDHRPIVAVIRAVDAVTTNQVSAKDLDGDD